MPTKISRARTSAFAAGLLVVTIAIGGLGCAANAQGEMRMGPDGTMFVTGKLGVSESGRIRLAIVGDRIEYQGGEVNFAHNDYQLENDENTIETLSTVKKFLAHEPYIKLRVEGHTDSTGKRSNNEQISQARAESVRMWLIHNGIEEERIEAKGFGESAPKTPEPEECHNKSPNKLDEETLARCEPIWAENRRAVFRIVEGLDQARSAMVASGSADVAAKRRLAR